MTADAKATFWLKAQGQLILIDDHHPGMDDAVLGHYDSNHCLNGIVIKMNGQRFHQRCQRWACG